MESQLQKYHNRDLRGAIQNMTVVQGTSKEGNIYYAIEITFINGYQKRIFLRSDEQFAWCNAFDMIDVNKTVEAEF